METSSVLLPIMLTCLCSWLYVSMNFCELPATISFPFISFAGTGTDKISGIIHGFNHPTEIQFNENFSSFFFTSKKAHHQLWCWDVKKQAVLKQCETYISPKYFSWMAKTKLSKGSRKAGQIERLCELYRITTHQQQHHNYKSWYIEWKASSHNTIKYNN